MARRTPLTLSRFGGRGAPLALAALSAIALAIAPLTAEADEADTEGEDAAPEEPAADEPEPIDVDALRREYLTLRDRLFRSRARAHAVASALYSSQLRVHLDFPRDRFVTPTRALIRVNGATVYEDTEGAIAADRAPRFEGFVAPGPHRVTIRVEAAWRDDARFETASEHTFTVVAPRGHRLLIRAAAGDGGDIGYEWEKSRSGSHKLRLDVDVEATPRETDESS